MIIPNPPQSNRPVSADRGRGVIEALRRLRPHPGLGVTINQTPEGTTYSTDKTPANDNRVYNIAGAVPCKVISGTAVGGFEVDIHALGKGLPKTGTGILYVLEISATGSLTEGSWVMGSKTNVVITGGSA